MKDKINATVRFDESLPGYRADAVFRGSLFIGTGETEEKALAELTSMLIARRSATEVRYPRLVALEF